MYGMVAAKYKKFPELKKAGLSAGPRLVVFTSEDSHYSVLKGAHWLGLGTDNVVKVATDEGGRMIPAALDAAVKKCLQQGGRPFFVNATCGTTVLGAFDPLRAISDVCKTHDLWLHVDACWGGGCLLSDKYRHLLDGIHLADSVAWNPHKMLGAPLTCSAFLIKEKGLLNECNSAHATYLFQQDKFYDVSYDTGDKSVQCGRKADALKFWLMWKGNGSEGLARGVDRAYEVAEYLRKKLIETDGFELVMDKFELTNICFWYIPPSLRGAPRDADWWEKLAKTAPKIKERMHRSGSMMIGYQPLPHKKLVNFFRLIVTATPEKSEEDMDYVIQQFQKFGSDL